MKLNRPRRSEADLYLPVKKWLEEKGYSVKPEMPVYNNNVDVVGVKETHVIAVELKKCLSHQVRYQARRNDDFADETWVAIGTIPKRSSVKEAAKDGIGVLVVIGEAAAVWLEADPSKHHPPVERHKKRILEKHPRLPDGIGGFPCRKGKGPAQEVKRRVIEYRKEHPKATWKELFEHVPNHYASHRSMCTSLNQWWWKL
jgi:hypothetical protein